MRVKEYDKVEEFLCEVENFLREDEVVNNLPLGILNSLKGNPSAYGEQQLFLGLVKKEGRITLTAVRTPPRNIILAGENDPHSLKMMVDYLLKNDHSIPGVIGLKSISRCFAQKWSLQTSSPFILEMKQRIYKLEEPNDVEISCGRLRPACDDDLQLLSKWIIDFTKEAVNEDISEENAFKNAKKKINEGRAFIWQTEQPVSMAWIGRFTGSTVAISGVYTPEQFRNRGYATSIVYTLSRMCLRKGFTCTLYTDLLNPTSNSIYRKIGYEPAADSLEYSFKDGSRQYR